MEQELIFDRLRASRCMRSLRRYDSPVTNRHSLGRRGDRRLIRRAWPATAYHTHIFGFICRIATRKHRGASDAHCLYFLAARLAEHSARRLPTFAAISTLRAMIFSYYTYAGPCHETSRRENTAARPPQRMMRAQMLRWARGHAHRCRCQYLLFPAMP